MFNRLQIRTLLACAFILFAVLLVAVGASGAYGIRSTNDALKDVSENVPTLRAVDQQLEALARARMRLDHIVDAPSANDSDATLPSVNALVSESDQAWRTYEAFPAESEERRIAARVDQARSALERNGIDPLLAALQSHNQDAAHQLAFERMPDLYNALVTATSDLAQFQFDNSAALLDEGKAHERTTLAITLAVTVMGFICAAGMWVTLTRAISKPLAAATEHFKAIESGDLTTRITIERADELGSLLQSLAKMQEGLRQTVSTIRKGVDLVADAAGEMATGNADLSGRTERQAASLEETAASMEELSATVKHNTSHALEASTLARAVGETASQGSAALQQVLDTMTSLKQGSGKIADITAVIEGIAFQTNILALNAAVEAARAGETGRGFAVVASEVRALAQRSGSAAKEIKDLLDASVSSVREGATQASEAGGRMNATLDALQRVTSLINEVAAASQEQARGIEQVTTAISQMDEVTQQNAALVEQAAAASSSMREQATTIRTVVARFRTMETQAAMGTHA